MTERPILFSAPMVRAILDGSKTQTRRVMKKQPEPNAIVTVEHYHPTVIDRHGDMQPGPEIFGALWDGGDQGVRCPYGAPGDTLWVRESLYIWGRWRKDGITKTGKDRWRFEEIGQRAAIDPPQLTIGIRECRHLPAYWLRPSIHMPRWASRITLKVKRIRVERLRDISEDDARAEGVFEPNEPIETYGPRAGRVAFCTLWTHINGPGAWEANPWVWVIKFEKVKP